MTHIPRKFKIAVVCGVLGTALLAVFFWTPLLNLLTAGYRFVSDRQRVEAFITGYGAGAPFVFIALQVLQVIVAPVPGEASGFLGGYLFGVWAGFLYSSIGLAIGSWINFVIGRFFGERVARRLIPADKWERLDHTVRHQGVIVLFLLFVFPGFPKDYLCLFLGLTRLPTKIFLVLATVGRMPGTYVLSLQGASLFEHNYWTLALLVGLCLAAALLAYRFRDTIYKWVEKSNNLPYNH